MISSFAICVQVKKLFVHKDGRPHFVYEQNTSDSNIVCRAFIIAVKGAGESDPSDNVTIPSLPDIGPVTASLMHQLWKSGSKIMANVSFEVNFAH